jgi:uncharacterized OsmC-like protein
LTETTASGLDPSVRSRQFTLVAETEHVRNMQHRARISEFGREFEIMSDEPDVLGGDNEHPTPLEYLSAAIGFCLLTQIERYGRMLKANVTAARCKVAIDLEAEGSVFAGTIASRCRAVRTEVEIESDEPPELIAALLRNADEGCYIRSALRAPVAIESTFRLNGADLAVADFPASPPRRR